MEQFHHVADFDIRWGRPMTFTSHRGDLWCATERGHIIRITDNPCSGQVYMQEVVLAQAKPMPNPI